jgi:hypothetical protein
MVVVERDDATETIVVLNGENTRQDWTANANGATPFNKGEKNVGIKE